MTQLETERLMMRPLRLEDAHVLAALWSDPDVTRYEGGPRNYEELVGIFEQDSQQATPPEFDMFPVVEKATGRVIGYCGLIDKEVDGKTEIELTYTFAKSAWGKGYATEMATALTDYAFKQIKLDRIIALINPANIASQRVAEKVGLVCEKTTVRPDGSRLQVYAMDRAGTERL